MGFENIKAKSRELFKRHNDTIEKVFEFEFYDLANNFISVLEAFEEGRRKPLKSPDYYEFLGSLKHYYRTFKGNIEYLEESKKEVEKVE